MITHVEPRFMATPYNLRARKRDDQSIQKSVKTPQSKRKRATATKVVKEDESDLEIEQQDLPAESDYLLLATELPRKRLTWDEEEESERSDGEGGGMESDRGEEFQEDVKSDGEGEGVESDDSEAGPDDVSLSVAKQQAIQQLHQQQMESEK